MPRLTRKYLQELREQIEALPEGELALTREEALQLIKRIESHRDKPPQVIVQRVEDGGQARAAAGWRYGRH
jgi:hypothetical protein